jgi:hypothetical protein
LIEVLVLSVLATEPRPQPAQRSNLLAGQKLAYVRLAQASVLSFSGGSQVLIETVARLGEIEVKPGEDTLAALLGDVVRTADIGDAGELRITFDSNAELLVRAHADRQSWAVAGPDGFVIVCQARGELAVWGDAKVPLGSAG